MTKETLDSTKSAETMQYPASDWSILEEEDQLSGEGMDGTDFEVYGGSHIVTLKPAFEAYFQKGDSNSSAQQE